MVWARRGKNFKKRLCVSGNICTCLKSHETIVGYIMNINGMGRLKKERLMWRHFMKHHTLNARLPRAEKFMSDDSRNKVSATGLSNSGAKPCIVDIFDGREQYRRGPMNKIRGIPGFTASS